MSRGSVEIMPVGADLFESGCEALVNPVDATTGAQGAGLALAFKQRWPLIANNYRHRCRAIGALPGQCWVSKSLDGPWLMFLATKLHWRDPSQLGWIKTGLTNLRHELLVRDVRSVAIPALGCGQGNLSWDDALPLEMATAERLAEVGVRVLLYPPHAEQRRHR